MSIIAGSNMINILVLKFSVQGFRPKLLLTQFNNKDYNNNNFMNNLLNSCDQSKLQYWNYTVKNILATVMI